MTLALGAVVGGRLGYVLLYRPGLMTGFSATPPFWDLLAIHRGGMASHGGMAGVVLAALLHARRADREAGHVLDLAAFAAPPGLALGRVANFVNGELIGRPAGEALPWAVKFPQALFRWDRAGIQRVVSDLSGPTRGALAEAVGPRAGPLATAQWLVAKAQTGHGQVRETLRAHLAARHPSQLYEALLEGPVLLGLLAWVWMRPRRPWVVAGWFCLGYAALRIVGEWYRAPDAHIQDMEFARWGITRGQLLSVPLGLAGAALIRFGARRGAAVGGWWRPSASAMAASQGD
jgi:phosphatidylglycerol:prolipoprotein diacylglycerol transferase